MADILLSERGERLLSYLPPYLQDDPYVQTIIDVCARELGRIEEAAQALRLGSFPQNADDTYGVLALFEQTFGLPVAPEDVTEDARRAKVVAAFQLRNAASGAAWEQLVTNALGTTNWSYEEGPGDYQVLLQLPYPAGDFRGTVAETLARRVTPAHLTFNATHGLGFIIGQGVDDPDASEIGNDTL